MPKYGKLLLAFLVWGAAFLRFPALFANHYHADEALFSSWARLIAVWRDPLLVTQYVDKPPLLFYLQALFFPLMGPVEWASRLPNYIASLLLLPLAALLTWRLYGSMAASLLTALFVLLSPLAIQFSATAYTDPLLTSLLLLSLLLVVNTDAKPILAGLVFALAVAVKYQAWLFLPLLIGFAMLQDWRIRQWKRWLGGFSLLLLAVAVWEILRTGSPAIWSNQISNFGGLRIVYSWELLPRLTSWLDLSYWLFGSTILLILFILLVLISVVHARARRSNANDADLLLIIYISGYMVFHWLIAVPVWDRYLLPIMPLVAILLARGITLTYGWIDAWLARRWVKKTRHVIWVSSVPLILLILLLVQFPVAISARTSRLPIGGQPEADQGAWQIASVLANEPYGTVLYDHWFSWQWRYHLFDKGVYVSWFPNPAALVGDLIAFGDSGGTRYIVLPDSTTTLPVKRAIQTTGYNLKEVYHTSAQPGMILYRLER